MGTNAPQNKNNGPDLVELKVEVKATPSLEAPRKSPLRLAPRKVQQASPVVAPPQEPTSAPESQAIKEAIAPQSAQENDQLQEQLKANTRTCPFCQELNAKKLTFCWSCDMPLYKGAKRKSTNKYLMMFEKIKARPKKQIISIASGIMIAFLTVFYFIPMDGLSLYRKHAIGRLNNDLAKGEAKLTDELLEGVWVGKEAHGWDIYVEIKKDKKGKWVIKKYSKGGYQSKPYKAYVMGDKFYFEDRDSKQHIIESVKENPGVLLMSRDFKQLNGGTEKIEYTGSGRTIASAVLFKISNEASNPNRFLKFFGGITEDAWDTFLYVVRNERDIDVYNSSEVRGADIGGVLAMVTKDKERLVRFTRVHKGRAADKAKIKIGDALVELNGKKITNLRESRAVIWTLDTYEPVKAKILRDGKVYAVNITPGGAHHRCYKNKATSPDRVYDTSIRNHEDRPYEYPFMLWWR